MAAHDPGSVVEVLDRSGWVPARVLAANGDGTYDVTVNLDETVHLGDAAAVLALVCQGSRRARVEAALRFYATQQGTLTLPGLRAYVTSTFKVLFEARPEARVEYGSPAEPASAKRLGDATARACFAEHGLVDDGELGADAFVRWYLRHLGEAEEEEEEEEAPPAWTAAGVAAEAFAGVDVDAALEGMLRYRDASNRLSRDAFCRAVAELSHADLTPTLVAAASSLFDAFDADGDGTVDLSELGAGLSVVCGGDVENRVRCAFHLFDLDGNGTISPDEMARYLTSVFRVAYARDPRIRDRVAATPEQLGAATAEQAFAVCDVDRNGKLDYREFRQWYLAQGGFNATASVTGADAVAALENGLRGLDPRAVFQHLGKHADARGCLSRDAFCTAFDELFQDAKDADVRAVLDAAFSLFDGDGDGVVDGAELAAGLGALCGGPHDVKVRLCFDLFDADGDGFLDEWEIRQYLQAIYRTSPSRPVDEEGNPIQPEALAAATARTIVDEADADGDGLVSFDEFARWIGSDALESEAATADGDEEDDDFGDEDEDEEDDAAASVQRATSRYEPVDPAPPPSAAAAVHELRAARSLLNLDHFSLDELIEVVVEAAPRGGLSGDAFAKVCRRLATLGGNARGDAGGKAAAARLAGRIYAAFDPRGTDDVDFVEVAAGLATLAPASMDDKIEAAFALYDVTRGGVARGELAAYLLAVYRVLQSCSANLAGRIHHAGGPAKLADDTAAACFAAKGLPPDKPLDVYVFKEFVCEGISQAYEI